ncbi:hypothetical protein [Reichenbachiella sp. MALMAid0571]|uniref:hypothetical protein n=1 Tax=Reichenbachiella sp. MALMAid0571 TaxID=3143939 RepID=UPI0032DF4EDE
MKNEILLIVGLGCIVMACSTQKLRKEDFNNAVINGKIANEGYNRCLRYVNGWLEKADSTTELISENFDNSEGVDTWNAYNNAADNYPFMVLTAYLLDKNLYKGRMLNMLKTEKSITSRVRSLPDDYSFSKQGFKRDTINMDWIIFGASEYCKDGLLPITEYIGDSPWKDRMLEMLDDLHLEFEVIKGADKLGQYNAPEEEVNGEMLQILSRVFWMTGEKKYLDWAIKIGDYYLLGEKDLTKVEYLRMRDHGSEVISGLGELYVTLHFADPKKKATYTESYYELLNFILEKGRNESGLFYSAFDPVGGDILDSSIADTWGYIYNAYYSVYLVDNYKPYYEEIIKVLTNLNDDYRNFPWVGKIPDGHADAIEGGINLLNRIPMDSLADWIDGEIRVMFDMQQENGIIGGWHGDGNFARTTIMYCLWKTQGTQCQPWRTDLKLGATEENGKLRIAINVENDWEGKIKFDTKRHKENMHLPIDYTRINQFPEWFTVSDDETYLVSINGDDAMDFSGKELIEGIEIKVAGGNPMYIEIQ